MLLLWTENLRVGVEEFDKDHRNLIGLVNYLHAAILEGKSRDALATALDELEDHVTRHFRREELAFLETSYPRRAEHKLEHRQLYEQFSMMRKRFESGEDAALAPEVMEYAYTLLKDHIFGSDRQYTEHLNGQGVY
jgi:hemerythrin-like metal-binding protein